MVLVKQSGASTVLEATQSVAISRCAFVNGRLINDRLGTPYLEIRSHGTGRKPTPVAATIEDTWFVRNFQAGTSDSQLVAFTTNQHAQAYFDDLTIRRCAFLGNAFMTEIAIAYAKQATIDHSLFYKTWPAGVLVSSTTSQDVVVKDSVIVVDDLARLGAVDHSPPIQLEGTKVYATSYKPGTAVPPGVVVDPKALSDRAALTPERLKVVDEAVAMPVGMPSDEVRAKVEQALRP